MFAAVYLPQKVSLPMDRLPGDTNSPRDHPGGKKHYTIVPCDDGLVDVYLSPDVRAYDTDLGIKEYDVSVRLVRGVVPWPEMEDDIRARYEAWCESGEVIDL